MDQYHQVASQGLLEHPKIMLVITSLHLSIAYGCAETLLHRGKVVQQHKRRLTSWQVLHLPDCDFSR